MRYPPRMVLSPVESAPSVGRRRLDELTLADLEAIRLFLRGGSVVDWHRLNFGTDPEIVDFLHALGYAPGDPADHARAEAIKRSAIQYLRRHFDFPVPRAVADLDLMALLRLASGRGHRQLCACTILKVMQTIQHLEARELLFMLPTSDEDVFHLVERKVYRAVGRALDAGYPIVEFIGGRKNKDSLYTKLLSKQEVIAAQIFDKLRFRIVTREKDDVFPVLNFIHRHLAPVNSVLPGQSTNTLFPLRRYAEAHPHLSTLVPHLQIDPHLEEGEDPVDNTFTAPSYRVVHFVVDLPVRLSEEMLVEAPPAAWALGRLIFVQTEFQILDQATDRDNERGEASHDAYKARQREAVMRRLAVGNLPHATRSGRGSTDGDGSAS